LRLKPCRSVRSGALNPFLPSPALYWVAALSLVGFAEMGIDKLLAVGRRSRVSERTLWATALVGGVAGIVLGGLVFHHKTSKAGFWAPVVAAAVIWGALAIFLAKPQVF
jgi:uncharacterized membrane protein YsdA (DUF1294 family)